MLKYEQAIAYPPTNAVVVAVLVAEVAAQRSGSELLGLGAQLWKPLKTSQLSSMMKNVMRSIRVIGMALSMYGLTKGSTLVFQMVDSFHHFLLQEPPRNCTVKCSF